MTDVFSAITQIGVTVGFSKMSDAAIQEYPDAVARVKLSIEERIEAEHIGVEFLDRLMFVVESRNKLAEAEADLVHTISSVKTAIDNLAGKLEVLAELKQVNLKLEREVLLNVQAEIKKQR